MPENAPLGRLFFVPKDDTEQLKDITVKLKGGVIGSGVIDTFKNIEVTATVQDDSHSHSNYVPSEGGFINGPIIRANEMGSAGSNNFGMIIGTAHENTGIMCGNGDADALTLGPTGKANLLIKSQWGVGFVDGASDNGITVGIDCRTGTLKANTVYGSIWNDYAEFRFCRDNFTPGQVVCENGDDSLSISSTRLQPGANIVSDTFGFAIGETDEAKCPIAVSGRVLAYPFEDRNSYNAGDPVCAGPGGTVSKMTREEVREYPDRVIGTVSAIPSYETWGSGNIKVNNRIWIKVN